MLQQQFLRLPAAQAAEAPAFLERLGLLRHGRLTEEVLKEGYSTTEPSAFLPEFRRHLRRLNPVLALMGRDHVSPSDLWDFLGTASHECRLALLRYLVSPEEVAARVLTRVRTSGGESVRIRYPHVSSEARRRLERLPGFEAVIVRALQETGAAFWTGPETDSRLNAMVEQPLGTVVLTVKPPGSRIEVEIKRAGRPTDRPLGIVHDRNGNAVPPSHRLDGGSAAETLRYEAGQAARLAKIYRLVHRCEAPVSLTTAITSPDTLPIGDGRFVHLVDYFSDPGIFGDEFPRMRAALRRCVASFRAERGEGLSGLEGDWGETLEFLQYVVPAQSILVGSSSFRVDLISRYLSPEGARYYFEGRPASPAEARRFADAVLGEVLGVYRPPGRKYDSHAGYLDAAFAIPANRARADRAHATVTRQLGTFWGTMLALRGYSFGESFVARNVGLRTVWARGRWRVQILFMDHDNLHLPPKTDDLFDPLRNVSAMIGDETHLTGRSTPTGHLPGTIDHLRAIYRLDEATAERHRPMLARSVAEAYRKTQQRLSTSHALARVISPRFIASSQAWDVAVAIFLRGRADGSGPEWTEEAGDALKARGLASDVVEGYLKSIEHFAGFLGRHSYLFLDPPGGAPLPGVRGNGP
jgi:hypothetical protein